MITNYNYVTNQEQKWYSEEEYNEALNKRSKTLDTCERLLTKLEEKEFNNERNDTNNNSGGDDI